MAGTDDPFALLERALTQTSRVIAGVGPDQGELPTPCRSWNVRTVVNHVIDDTRSFAEMARGGTYDRQQIDVPETEWQARFDAGADELLAAWRDEGELDDAARNRMSQQIAEFALHSWDLTEATGQTLSLEEAVADQALAWGRGVLKPEMRGDDASGKAFGPEVLIADSAPIYDRLAGFFGRHPE